MTASCGERHKRLRIRAAPGVVTESLLFLANLRPGRADLGYPRLFCISFTSARHFARTLPLPLPLRPNPYIIAGQPLFTPLHRDARIILSALSSPSVPLKQARADLADIRHVPATRHKAESLGNQGSPQPGRRLLDDNART